MPSPAGDPTYIKNKDRYFIELAKAVARGSTHPSAKGGCVIVRGREIIGDGRSLLTDSKVEVDCLRMPSQRLLKQASVLLATIYPLPILYVCVSSTVMGTTALLY